MEHRLMLWMVFSTEDGVAQDLLNFIFGRLLDIDISIFHFVIYSLLFGMKFCRATHIQPQDEQENIKDYNQIPALIFNDSLKLPPPPPQQEEVYRLDIEQYFLGSSQATPELARYFQFQKDLTENMRGVLLNWLVQVNMKYKLMGETFFLTVKIIDSFLNKQNLKRNQLQLLGITALWIAAKYQETYQVPKLENLVFICDGAYTGKDILAMEGRILVVIGFNLLTTPSPLFYFQILQHHSQLSEKDYWMGRYLLEASVFDLKFQNYSPAVLAFTIHSFIKKLRGTIFFGEENCRTLCGAFQSETKILTRELLGLWKKTQTSECLNSLRSKYGHSQFLQVSKIRLTQRGK